MLFVCQVFDQEGADLVSAPQECRETDGVETEAG